MGTLLFEYCACGPLRNPVGTQCQTGYSASNQSLANSRLSSPIQNASTVGQGAGLGEQVKHWWHLGAGVGEAGRSGDLMGVRRDVGAQRGIEAVGVGLALGL